MAKKSKSPELDSPKPWLPTVSQIFPTEPRKSEIQKIKIIEAAITSFAHDGLEKTTYSRLAKKCKISRTLIHHYFPTLDSLFILAAHYVRQTLLHLASEGLAKGNGDPYSMLKGYVEGCFKWLKIFPDQGRFWLLFYYQTSLGGQARIDNSTLVEQGHLRIQGLLKLGNQVGQWKVQDIEQTAKVVQLLITGCLISSATEDGYMDLDKASRVVMAGIDLLLNVRASGS